MIAPNVVRPTAPPVPLEQPEDDRHHEDGEQAHRQLDHASTDRRGVSITVLTSRGAAAVHLSRFQDAWAELAPADRAYFAEDLRELLVDAYLEAPAPTA